jgi:SsrA-binding protein
MNTINIRNKKANFEYHLTDIFEAGMVLLGSEIKSLRTNNGSIKEAYCVVKGGEVFIRNMYIKEYDKASFNIPDPKRERKLLLNRTEINKLQKGVKNQGVTIVPVKVFLSKKGQAKIQIALATGKKLFDKREDLKNKDVKRDLDRLRKSF